VIGGGLALSPIARLRYAWPRGEAKNENAEVALGAVPTVLSLVCADRQHLLTALQNSFLPTIGTTSRTTAYPQSLALKIGAWMACGRKAAATTAITHPAGNGLSQPNYTFRTIKSH